jgi:aminoglycoside 6'-N-acetyltransferase I
LDGACWRGRERRSAGGLGITATARDSGKLAVAEYNEGMTSPTIRQARRHDRDELAKMQGLLWPAALPEELLKELDDALGHRAPGTLPAVLLVSTDENGALTGFLSAGLRSHADGCDPARPVGYVEGWFVHEKFRKQGVGKALLNSAEEWARAHGCVEMASDALIENAGSQRAHEALGFEVVDRCVHFRKKL